MDTIKQQMYNHESQHLSPIKNQPPLPPPNTGFPMLAIAVLCIMATAFLLVSYYIFVTRCCFHWQQINPLRHFSSFRARRTEDPLMAYSPSWQSRGLDETLIREIPTFQYTRSEGKSEEISLNKCVVCLNDFQEQDTLRVLPNCKHAFHLDCIDIWLQNNANCPLCRLSISGTTRYPMDRIIAPTSSPQDPHPFISNTNTGSDEDFVVIELGNEGNESRQQHLVLQSRRHSSSPRKFEQKSLKTRKSHHLSSMGDECINVREKDDQFSILPIRRSFSMDSAADRHIYLSVQEIIRQNGHQNETRNNEECSNRVRRPFFSFGNVRGPRSAVLPIEL